MTLSLDDVRNKRFRMAKRSGYEVVEVDEFVDEVEATFEQLLDENQNLRKQVESLKTAEAQVPGPVPAEPRPSGEAPQPIVVTTGKEASSAVVRLVEMSTEQAERLVSEATEDANRIRDEANRSAEQTTTEARTRAELIESESRLHAERVQADALNRAETLDQEIEVRRAELISRLEHEREDLSHAVHQLRDFESSYRASMTDQLRNHLAVVEAGRAEPDGAPPLADVSNVPDDEPVQTDTDDAEPSTEAAAHHDHSDAATEAEQRTTSDTPRLDALLGDKR